MNVIGLIFFLLFWQSVYAQNWSSWSFISSNKDIGVQYSYKLNPVTSGNSFSLKIKNVSSSVLCGRFDVHLNMRNGRKLLSYSFKDLKPGFEKDCPGVYQFADVQSFSSITNFNYNACSSSVSSHEVISASFVVEYHNEFNKTGTFKFVDPKGQYGKSA